MPPRASRNDTATAGRTQPNKGALQSSEKPFWQTKSLDEMTSEQWESLCDRCGRCCLVKLEDEDTGQIHMTDICCKLFDEGSCSCVSYAARHKKVSDCIKLTPETVRAIRWLPSTCAYRLVAEGKALADWHPLVSGSFETVHEAKISVRGSIGGSEKTVKLRDYVDHIVE